MLGKVFDVELYAGHAVRTKNEERASLIEPYSDGAYAIANEVSRSWVVTGYIGGTYFIYTSGVLFATHTSLISFEEN